jgi:hypothetical protein
MSLTQRITPSRVMAGEMMKRSEVLQAWGSILLGRPPNLSIEITKECPLRCPGCNAFDAAHLGSSIQLRQLSDFKGDELVSRVLAVIDEHKPLHVSLVGGIHSSDIESSNCFFRRSRAGEFIHKLSRVHFE